MRKDDENFLEQLQDAGACKNTGDPVSLPTQGCSAWRREGSGVTL